MILVAHDRWFLEAVTTSVLELTPARAHYFAGPWHEWRREKASRAARRRRRPPTGWPWTSSASSGSSRGSVQEVEGEAGPGEAHADRAPRAGALACHRELLALTRKRRTLGFDFLRPPRTGRVVLEAEGIGLTAGDKLCSRTPRSSSSAARRSASSARTGAGRRRSCWRCSAAIRSTRGTPGSDTASSPGTSRSTRIEPLPGLGARLRGNRDRAPATAGPDALGRFLFSGWETHERAVTALSGGERRRLALALLVASGANFLVLDEPTNHLDLESREALEAALEAFRDVLIVSHDRALLDAVPDRIVAIEERALRSYDGGWADSRASGARASRPPPRRR